MEFVNIKLEGSNDVSSSNSAPWLADLCLKDQGMLTADMSIKITDNHGPYVYLCLCIRSIFVSHTITSQLKPQTPEARAFPCLYAFWWS